MQTLTANHQTEPRELNGWTKGKTEGKEIATGPARAPRY